MSKVKRKKRPRVVYGIGGPSGRIALYLESLSQTRGRVEWCNYMNNGEFKVVKFVEVVKLTRNGKRRTARTTE